MDEIKNKLELMDIKIDKLDTRLDKMDIQQTLMNADLKYHIKRTNILEDEFKPIKLKYAEFKGILKFVGAVIAVAGLLEVILRFFLHF